jgi:hypothetical protein
MNDLEDKVLREITRRNLTPKPLLYFIGKRSVFWTLAAISVILGAIAAATTIFLVADFVSTGGKALDELPFDNLAPYAPIVWTVLFATFGWCAQASFSATRNGYRYRPSAVVATAMTVSAGLGLLLYVADVGGITHRYLSSHMRSYADYTTIPYDHWSRPAQGYLGGEVVSVNPSQIVIRDFKGVEWTIDITSAQNLLTAEPLEEGDIAIRGVVTGEHTFKADSVASFD